MRLRLLAACLLLGLAACAGLEPFDPPEGDSLKDGPGLLTGESGEFVIFRRAPAPAAEAGEAATTTPLARAPAP